MDKTLVVRMTKDRHGQPLAEVRNFPGLSADMYPEQMRAMAKALLAAADDCEAQEGTTEHHCAVEREYSLSK